MNSVNYVDSDMTKTVVALGATTPIMLAETKEVMELLSNDDRIDAGATDDHGRTVLHYVCVSSCKFATEEQIVDTIGMLLRSPKIHYAKTLSGKTPLHFCYDKEKRIEEILEVAVERNIDVNEVDGDDRTLAHFAFGYGWGRRCPSDYLEPTCRKKEDILPPEEPINLLNPSDKLYSHVLDEKLLKC